MDLNQIQLPASLVAELYSNYLVEDTVTEMSAAIPDGISGEKEFQYLGKNQKGICILVNYANDVYLPDEQLHFLTSILKACALNLGDVAIVNHHRQKMSVADLINKTKCRQLLIFGIEPEAIGLEQIPVFNIASGNNCQIVLAPAIGILNNNNAEGKSLKSKLWMCLKQLFNV